MKWTYLRKAFRDFFKDLAPVTIKQASYNKKTETMTITYSSGEVEQFEGECTVWHTLPYMHRCPTWQESQLSEIWTYIKRYGNPYPTAHQNQEKK